MKKTERIRFIGGRHVINSNRNTNFNSFQAKRTLLLTLELCLANDSFVCGARQKNLRSAYAGIFLLPEKPSQNRLVFNVHRHGGPKHQVFFVNGTKIVEQTLSYFVCFSKSLGLCTKIVHKLPTFRFWNFFKRSYSIESF